ncbi:CBM96 family carbohydrate-binding protein [Dyadobacter bucti]|uniref:CBM96 family carbohydrate-binding protein n=1 Tax=Dyadobacter bucti TaxID=2572203 RepID=UPI003F70EE89
MMKKHLLGLQFFLLCLGLSESLLAQPAIQWEKTIGTVTDEYTIYSVTPTPDGGHILAASALSDVGGDKSQPSRGYYDFWIVKLSADGAKEWDRARGGDSALSWCTNVIQTRDDNYIAYGITRSSAGGDKSEEKEGIWLIKFNSAGTKIWDKALGGFTYGNLAETADGGLILVGTALNDENQTEPSRGGNDYWIVKLAPENPSFSQTTLRINAGGADFTTGTKQRYIGDMYYAGIRRVTYHPGGNILGTTSDELYRTARSSPSFSYNIPVINGEVTVTLHFAETYFGVPGTRGKDGGAGSRRFHVNVEGSRQLTNYDIFAKAGGAMRANQISFPATVTDNVLNIDFLTGAADQPKVCAIEVVTENLTFYPIADAFVRGGIYSATNFGTSADLEVKTVSNDPEISRDSYIKFQMPSPETPIVSAKLRLYGHNHQDSRKIEIFAYEVDDNSWTETGITLNNAPYLSTYKVGGTTVSDNYQYYEFNVTSYLGNNKLAGNTEISFRISNTNSRNARFIFNSKEAGANPPQLLIQTVYGNARLGQEEIVSEAQEKQPSIVFPNPIKHQFTVSLSPEHNGAISFEMVDAAGKSHFIPTPQNAKPGENAEIAISSLSLRTGIYLLKIESDSHKEAVRLVITE